MSKSRRALPRRPLTMSESLTTAEDGRTPLPSRRDMSAGAPAAPATPAPAAVPAENLSAEELGRRDAATLGEVSPAVDVAQLAALVSERLAVPGRRDPHPLERFDNAQAWLRAAREGDPDALAAFAIAENITSESPGVMANGWVTDLKRLVDRGTRVITALGGRRALPDAGMSIDYPYVSETLSSLVGEQSTQLTDVTSADVEILKGTGAIKTYAGGSTLSWQLINRSSPSYVEAYLRILLAAFAYVEDAAFVDALEAGAAAGPDVNLSTVTTEAAIKDAVFSASLSVDDATGAPASVLIAGRAAFLNLGKLLTTPAYGTQNVEGIGQASNLRVEVSGIPVVYSPAMTTTDVVATNDLAAAWHGTGPAAASAEDVTRLGRDQVVWGMGASMLYVPAGVVLIKDVP